MTLLGKDPEQEGLREIEAGVKDFRKGLSSEEDELKRLFTSLKTDLLDQFLEPGAGHVKRQHIRILHEQVRHVIGIARAVGDKSLLASFQEEERIVQQVEELVDRYPDVELSASPDLRASLERLRSMLLAQQRMIFEHEEILYHEKERLVSILQQVEELRKERVVGQTYRFPKPEPVASKDEFV